MNGIASTTRTDASVTTTRQTFPSRVPLEAKRFVIYARKSTEREDRQVQSIEDQVKGCRSLAERHGLSIVETVTEARSAKRHGTRPGFRRLLDLLEAGAVDGVLSWHPDRLARNAIDGGWILDLLDRRKLRDLRFATFTFENTPEGKFMLGMLFTKSKYDVDKLAVDVHRGQQSQREKGGFPHRAPEGYLNDRNTRTVVADPVRFPLVRRAIDLILSGAVLPADALRLMNEEWGYRMRPTKRNGGGGPLRRSVFYRMLENPFYYGECRMAGGYETYPGTQPPLMTRAEFDRLQEIIGRKEKPSRRRHDFPLTGLIRCGRCGAMITATLAKGHTYYHCTNRSGRCDRRGVRGEDLEAQVRERLEALSVHEDYEQILFAIAERYLQQSGEPDRAQEAARERALSEAKRRREKLVSLYTADLISLEEYQSERMRLTEEIDALERHRNTGDTSGESVEAAVETARGLVSYAVWSSRTFADEPPTPKRLIARELGSPMVLTAGKLLLEPDPVLVPFFEHAPALRRFKPLKNGSESTRGTAAAAAVPCGSTSATAIKPEENAILESLGSALADVLLAHRPRVFFPRIRDLSGQSPADTQTTALAPQG